MSDKYILEGRTPVRCDDLYKWARWFENGAARRVAFDHVGDGLTVSTVFLGLDHNWGEGPPQLFETMIFGGPHDEYQERYSTWDEAVHGHARAVAMAQTQSSQCTSQEPK